MQQRADEPPQPPRPGLLDRLLAPWRTARRDDVFEAKLDRIDSAVTTRIPGRLALLESILSADRDLLAEIASGLTSLATPVNDLIASEAALRARVVELEGQAAADEAGDLEAAQSVKTAFDGIADKFRSEPELPDVEPLPEVPTEPGTPAEDGTTPAA